MNLSDVRDLPNGNGKMGMLADGREVNIRTNSSYKKPTLEIYKRSNNTRIKIRYMG